MLSTELLMDFDLHICSSQGMSVECLQSLCRLCFWLLPGISREGSLHYICQANQGRHYMGTQAFRFETLNALECLCFPRSGLCLTLLMTKHFWKRLDQPIKQGYVCMDWLHQRINPDHYSFPGKKKGKQNLSHYRVSAVVTSLLSVGQALSLNKEKSIFYVVMCWYNQPKAKRSISEASSKHQVQKKCYRFLRP